MLSVPTFQPDQPLAWLGGLSAQEFLRDYWQKKPLLVRNAFPELANLVDQEDLITLAQEEGVEARIILEKDGKKPWELRKGPFKAKQLKQMPASHWTLLVQAVDHYLPELAAYWQYFSFLPSWRTDDIMISYAPVGGSVGPHYDQYDVFLVQGQGQRRWQLGDYCDSDSPRLAGTPLRILADMPITFDEVVNQGDLLYVPPRLAHYGVAQNDCLTFSFGFRAPALNQVLEQLVDCTLERIGSDQLYRDPPLQVEKHSAWLNPQHLAELQQQVLTLLQQSSLTEILAPFLSEAKYPDYEPVGDELSEDDLLEALQSGYLLCRDPASRFVYTGTAGHAETLYINGETIDTTDISAEFVALLADQRQLSGEDLAQWLANPTHLSWLQEQVATGYWLLLDTED